MSATLPDTIAAASRLIKAREISPVELVDGLLKRIALIDPVLSSFITVTAEEAIAQARKAERDERAQHRVDQRDPFQQSIHELDRRNLARLDQA